MSPLRTWSSATPLAPVITMSPCWSEAFTAATAPRALGSLYAMIAFTSGNRRSACSTTGWAPAAPSVGLSGGAGVVGRVVDAAEPLQPALRDLVLHDLHLVLDGRDGDSQSDPEDVALA